MKNLHSQNTFCCQLCLVCTLFVISGVTAHPENRKKSGNLKMIREHVKSWRNMLPVLWCVVDTK